MYILGSVLCNRQKLKLEKCATFDETIQIANFLNDLMCKIVPTHIMYMAVKKKSHHNDFGKFNINFTLLGIASALLFAYVVYTLYLLLY